MLDFVVSLPKEPAITISKHRIKSLKTIPEPFYGNMDFKSFKTQKMDPFEVHPFSAFSKNWSKVPCPSPRRERLPLLAPGRPPNDMDAYGWFQKWSYPKMDGENNGKPY